MRESISNLEIISEGKYVKKVLVNNKDSVFFEKTSTNKGVTKLYLNDNHFSKNLIGCSFFERLIFQKKFTSDDLLIWLKNLYFFKKNMIS